MRRAAVVCAIVVAGAAAAGLHAQGSRATVYATVINEENRPVRGLQSADLVLRDGGVRQGIVDAQPASDPLAVAVVISGFDAAELAALRPAIDDAVRTLRGASAATQVGLVGAGPNVVMMGHDPAAWTAAFDALASAPAARSATDAITKGCEALAAAPPDRRTVLAVVNAGDGTTSERPDRMAAAADANHVAVWTVEFRAPSAPAWPKAVNAAFDDAARLGGTLRQSAASMDAVKARLGVAVDCLLSQYLVTYNWPDPMLSAFSLVTRHDVGRVLTPSWSK